MVEETSNDMTSSEILSIGDVVEGKVIKIEEKRALVDVGYKLEGILPISELSSLHVEKVSDVLAEGDSVNVKVTKLSEEELVVSKKDVDADRAWDDLEQRFTAGTTFTVVIADVVKGGLVVDLGVRGFIPASLVERHFVEDFSNYKDKELDVKIVELDKEKRKLILSHRAVLDEQADQAKEQTLHKINAGDVLEGTVQRLTDFGAFVDIGGVDGLVHISQLAHHHVDKPSDVVKEGDEVQVKVLSVDYDNERISLSIKETLPGPWEAVKNKVHNGDKLEGTVKRLVPFGAFVELFPGVEGLVHISEISHEHIGTPNEVLSEGEQVEVKVLDVNTSDKRISLSIRELQEPKKVSHETQAYQSSDDSGGFSLGDMIGDQLKKYK